jgi:putative peptidoglycan lipid II flippase
MLAFVLSNVTGLIRQMLVSREFGTQSVLDAYTAAATFPDLLFSLIAGGALASAFIPVLTDFITKDDRHNAWYLTSAITNLVVLALIMVSVLSMILADQIVQYILAPWMDPELQALTASLMRILLISPVVFGVSGILMGVLNANQIFIWSALAPTMYWLGMIFGVLALTPRLGIYGLAWGAVLGAFMHLFIQIPATLKLPSRRYFPTLGLSFPKVREVGKLMGPRLVGVAVVQINFVVNTIIATALISGSLASIKYAWAIMTMPQVIIAQAIAIAALPTFSAQVSMGLLNEMRSSLAATLRGVVVLALPASLGLIILRQPIISMLFERGEFNTRSTDMVAWALLWYTVGLVGHSIVEIVSRAFYALHDTRTPVIIGTIVMSLNVLFSFAFAKLFSMLGWMPHGGLALANSAATTLEMVALLIYMRRRLNGLNVKDLLTGVAQVCLASIFMSVVLFIWLELTTARSVWFVGLGGVLLGGIVFMMSALLLRIREAVAAWQEIKTRFRFKFL